MYKPENQQQDAISLPAILCDIDGVVYRGGELCGNSQEVISDVLLKKYGYGPGSNKGVHMPFTFLTNGGMFTEQEKVNSLNDKLGLKKYQLENRDRYTVELEEQGPKEVNVGHLIMCHTPVSEYEFKNLDKNDPDNLDFTVLLSAGQRGHTSEHLRKNYKFKPQSYLTLEEYAVLFPEITYFVRYEFQ